VERYYRDAAPAVGARDQAGERRRIAVLAQAPAP
jgi:hypothetical protein